jgi:hypothetical protein
MNNDYGILKCPICNQYVKTHIETTEYISFNCNEFLASNSKKYHDHSLFMTIDDHYSYFTLFKALNDKNRLQVSCTLQNHPSGTQSVITRFYLYNPITIESKEICRYNYLMTVDEAFEKLKLIELFLPFV